MSDKATVETKHYSDGTAAIGVGPLPEFSPAQQDAIERDDAECLRQRAVEAMASFPLPSQSASIRENYRRILSWLYGGPGVLTNAALVIDLGDHHDR